MAFSKAISRSVTKTASRINIKSSKEVISLIHCPHVRIFDLTAQEKNEQGEDLIGGCHTNSMQQKYLIFVGLVRANMEENFFENKFSGSWDNEQAL